MKSELNNSSTIDLIRANHSLTSYLTSLSRGRKATPRSWLYEKKSASAVLHSWVPLMITANNKSKFGEIFNQFDMKQIEKFGPQGAVPPMQSKECLEVITPLYEPSKYNNPNELQTMFHLTKSFAEEAFGTRLRVKRPKEFESVIDNMRERDTLVTNSGFPRFVRRSTVKQMEIQDAKTGKAYEYPAIILFRQYNGKLRPVWMFPMSLNLIEFSFSQIIQSSLSNSPSKWIRDYLSPWRGYEDVKLTLTSQWKNSQVDGGDTTKMDAHMRPAQIELIFHIVKWLFQEQFWESLHQSLMHICYIDLLYSQDRHYTGIHGLASGSGWTQLTETVLQLFMAWKTDVVGQGIGDDFYWLSNMSAHDLVKYLESFGLPANPSKQSISKEELHFLQRLNHKEFFSREFDKVLGAYYPTIRALNSMLNPEKFHKPKDWNSNMFCIRNYMILENCVDNPCFSEFVKFVVHGHKDMAPFAKQSAAVLNKIQIQSRLVPGLNPSYNQEKREKPLSSFASIQLAKKL